MCRKLITSICKKAGIASLLLLLSTPLLAVPEVSSTVPARTKYGIIRSINLEERTAVISGFKYVFGAVERGRTAEVKMYGSEHGAFELLKVGMKVKVVYGEFNIYRVVVRLQQLADDTLIPEI